MVDAQQRLVRQDGVLVQEAHGQTVLLRLADGSYYALDDVGAAVWDLVDGQRSVEEIITAIHAAFDAPADVIRTDVLAFTEDLLAEGLLQRGA